MPGQKVAIITGGNTGIGLATVDRLLTEHGEITVCLACRNRAKAETARLSLIAGHPGASIDIVELDTSRLKSVVTGCAAIKAKYNHVDYCYFNAGILPTTAVRWGQVWAGLFSTNVVHTLTTGEGLTVQTDGQTEDGLQRVFATNVFGHFVMLQELSEILGASDPTQIIWTSSSNSSKKVFSFDDIQHIHGQEPYGSSKYLTDLLSVAINEKFNTKLIYSHTVCPGLVMTGLTQGILPKWLWTFIIPFLLLLRVLVPALTLDSYKASEALVWLSNKSPHSLDPLYKFHSEVSAMGVPRVKAQQMDLKVSTSLKAYDNLNKLYKKATHKVLD